MAKIGLIGAGNIGSRYLQALSKMPEDTQIHAMDIDSSSIQIAQERYNQVKTAASPLVHYDMSMEDMGSEFDLIIVATSSRIRRAVIEEIVQKKCFQYLLLEKVLFQSMDDYQYIDELLKARHIKAWVNCTAREFPHYNLIKKELEGQSFTVHMAGSEFGLACNAVHSLDLFCYWNDSEKGLEISSEFLDAGTILAKRQNYIEFTGTLSGRVGRCCFFSISSLRESADIPLQTIIKSANRLFIVDESNQWMSIHRKENDWVEERRLLEQIYTSEIMYPIINHILEKGSCRLPSYEVSSEIHKKMLAAFLAHMNRNGGKETICPIT